MKKPSTIDAIFKRNRIEIEPINEPSNSIVESDHKNSEDHSVKSLRVGVQDGFDLNSLARDSGLRPHIWKYPIEKHDEVRRAYIKVGLYQCMLSTYPKSKESYCSFQLSWFKLFSSWLEYSPSVDAEFFLPCFLFHKKDGPHALNAFTDIGFRTWKKVRDGRNCAFLGHIGKVLISSHRNAEKACADLMNQPSHIARKFQSFTTQEIAENRLRLKTSIEAIRWLAFQGNPFRGHDESKTSPNRGNFLELLTYASSYNDKVAEVLKKAP